MLFILNVMMNIIKLTTEQLELLSLGLNFGIAPKRFPIVEYVTATERGDIS